MGILTDMMQDIDDIEICERAFCGQTKKKMSINDKKNPDNLSCLDLAI